MAQVTDEQLVAVLDEEMNSIALSVKHIVGNLRTDFLTSGGERPDRTRNSEFVEPPAPRHELNQLWDSGWQLVFSAFEPLSDDGLHRTVTIRGEPHSVLQAINRQVAHYCYRCGQIVLLAKHFNSSHWQSLSVPRGHSAGFNNRVLAGEASQR